MPVKRAKSRPPSLGDSPFEENFVVMMPSGVTHPDRHVAPATDSRSQDHPLTVVEPAAPMVERDVLKPMGVDADDDLDGRASGDRDGVIALHPRGGEHLVLVPVGDGRARWIGDEHANG